MSLVLISFLGSGSYKESTYYFDGKEAKATPYVQIAECELFPINKAFILVTEGDRGSRLQNWDSNKGNKNDGLKIRFEKAKIQAEAITIPDCSKSEDFWILFKKLNELFEENKDNEIILDITHSFRAIPFFASAVLFYRLLINGNNSNIRHILYGQEPIDGKSPIWDLEAFLGLFDYSLALGQFLETGNGKRIGAITKKLANQGQREAHSNGDRDLRNSFNDLKIFGSALETIGDNLAVNRVPDLLTANNNSKSNMQNAYDYLLKSESIIQDQMPPLGSVLQKIQSMLEPMQSGVIWGRDGIDSWLSLAELQLKFNRYADCVATLREGIISLFLDENSFLDKNKRESIYLESLNSLFDLRNDLNHAGFRKNAINLDSARSGLSNFIEKFKDPKYIDELINEHSKQNRTKFLNISNHPHKNWDDKQVEAARSICQNNPDFEIIDVPFPQVDPMLSNKELDSLAREIVEEYSNCAMAAMVQGEFCLTFKLIKRFQSQKITCYSATTHRNTIDLPDGKKQTQFKFIAFREY